ncbi:hypothetical protein BCR41DRAFT_392010 [Lobosporangium transversale]|uniref:Uncharacterized protein n=1 Tax=Lobosporangium transversale TaxID=64571 RepID=A0A1Y2H3H6_9FUNG|nr:hypothetical protein BCR41DRAFT_392010 [Lobosporangium transversale]ORZ28541.1 hypothetical protein BCR41DRAFT_392010 [Lobosporangium transversale]|eukprot:XP_021886226.1 hypothetical protein BCR41DRAFT_392010 [Lobosporangium transversale]
MVQGGRMKKPVVAEACQAVASIPVKISNNDNHQVFKEAIEDLFGRQNGAASSTGMLPLGLAQAKCPEESSGNKPNAIDRCLRTIFGLNVTTQRKQDYIYDRGKGVSQDYSKTFGRYLKAFKQRGDDAQSSLGFIHLEGKGVSQDYSKAMSCGQ